MKARIFRRCLSEVSESNGKDRLPQPRPTDGQSETAAAPAAEDSPTSCQQKPSVSRRQRADPKPVDEQRGKRPPDRLADRRPDGSRKWHRSENNQPARARTDGSSNAISNPHLAGGKVRRMLQRQADVHAIDVSRSVALSRRDHFANAQVIASRLAESIGPIPTFYLTVEIEMDNAAAASQTDQR